MKGTNYWPTFAPRSWEEPRRVGNPLGITYHREQLITASLWQKAAHDLRLREGSYRL